MTGLTKIVFDEERKVLVDDDKLEFKGTRVSKVVHEETHLVSSRDYAETSAISKLEEIGRERYHADAYELLSLSSRDDSGMGEYIQPSFGATARAIFYRRN